MFKKLKNKSNFTKADNSEPNEVGFNSWLAGMIDGDGHLYTNKKGYFGLEITVPNQDEALLMTIKNHFGGSVKPRSGSQSVRYRLHHMEGMIDLILAINGKIRNRVRLSQLENVIDALKRLPKFRGNAFLNKLVYAPAHFDWRSAYATGLFDSDGTVTINVQKHLAHQNLTGKSGKIARLQEATQLQLSIRITQKYPYDLFMLMRPFKFGNKNGAESLFLGRIYYDKSQNGYFTWFITSRSDIQLFLHYITTWQSRSVMKSHRLRLINKYYDLVDTKAFLKPVEALDNIRWRQFAIEWFKYSYEY